MPCASATLGLRESSMHITFRTPRTLSLLVPLFASLLAAQAQQSQSRKTSDVPDKEMMEPVTALARYMAHVEGATMPSVFADDGVVIVEDFAPYIFRGKEAVADWNAGFRHHAGFLRDLKFTFGPAHDF